MRKAVVACAVVGIVMGSGAARADGNAKAGAQKIKTLGCIQCHGRDGVSKLPEAPNLAGQVQVYVVAALGSYRSKERKNEIMNTVAENLKDADIADLAAYYNSIQVNVTPPPKP
jgi:cytochrome c553